MRLLDDFSSFLNQISEAPLYVLDVTIPLATYVLLDLSVSNTELNLKRVSSSETLGAYVNKKIAEHNGLVAYGGYLEHRNIYNRSAYFSSEDDNNRNIHLGIDIWSSTNTPIFTPLNGVVHSFKNNTNFGDYGPTIILQHEFQKTPFYTLYGHLSLESLGNLSVGQVFKQGEQIGTLGDETVNGDYPPHLHFQIIRDLQGMAGDYPGVCARSHLEFYSKNCPNPNLLLKL
ncbi:peptidoglycan DD-metalloendopeptidase family protein [Cognatitamlana onchidii]|uniref:peptidoglycan DD-metalloendopeptidase family protein n=1 Tax=Cognatitamlana onchidii TaxID=2562860 RepID=UPI0029392575|nr:peptidoglycan DD-metalloendopeptidase family protein [Algibacter onchidii]